MAGDRFWVVLIGHEEVAGHVEYIFHVAHPCGSTWKVQWRFSDLLTAHTRLSKSIAGLPPFPPKCLPGLGAILGQDFIVQRAVALQRYFEGALAREDVVRAPAFQSGLLGMRAPEAVESVRVLRWAPCAADAAGGPPATASVELLVVAGKGSATAPVELLLACSPSAPTASGCARLPAAASAAGTPVVLRVDGLPSGEDLLLEVRARNAVGCSPPVAIRVAVPGRRRPPVYAGMRVKATWAGDGGSYDATVQRVGADGLVVVNWLRPAPLSGEYLHCVCEAGGDDTSHRIVRRDQVAPIGEAILELDPELEGAATCFALGAGDVQEADRAAEARTAAGGPPPRDAGCRPAGAWPPLCREVMEEITDMPSEARPRFRLGVRLSEGEACPLEWSSSEELAPRVDKFMQVNRLRPLFRAPLLRRAALLETSGQPGGTVDIVDLVD